MRALVLITWLGVLAIAVVSQKVDSLEMLSASNHHVENKATEKQAALKPAAASTPKSAEAFFGYSKTTPKPTEKPTQKSNASHGKHKQKRRKHRSLKGQPQHLGLLAETSTVVTPHHTSTTVGTQTVNGSTNVVQSLKNPALLEDLAVAESHKNSSKDANVTETKAQLVVTDSINGTAVNNTSPK